VPIPDGYCSFYTLLVGRSDDIRRLRRTLFLFLVVIELNVVGGAGFEPAILAEVILQGVASTAL
jgi:hypothetical protein